METLARRGYRFIAPVSAAPAHGGTPAEPAARRPWAHGRVWLVALALVAGLFAVGGRLFFPRRVSAARSTLLVLPFQNLSGDPEQE